MMIKRILLSLAILISTYAGTYAHALWIETNPVGKKGIRQDVKVFYGEYAEHAPDKIADWYSDVSEFTLWLLVPGKEKVKVPVTSADTYFSASFTPEADGVYCLFISHDAKKLGGKTKYQFNTSATVNVGTRNENCIASISNALKFSAQGNAVKAPIKLNTMFNDSLAAKFQTTVFSPKGWSMQIAGKNGQAEFIPEWKGRYMIEVSDTKSESGQHHGAAYESVWRCATSLVEVN